MPKILNENYKKFIEEGIIAEIGKAEIEKVLEGVTPPNQEEARALILILYITGARPAEVLQIKSDKVFREGAYVRITIPGVKHGRQRVPYFQYTNKFVREIFNFAQSIPPEMYLFYHFRSNRIKYYQTKQGLRQYKDISNNIYYWFDKWFSGVFPGSISAYYLRHNRFSKLAMADATMEEIRQLKGSKTIDSIIPYIHLSSKGAKSLARKIR